MPKVDSVLSPRLTIVVNKVKIPLTSHTLQETGKYKHTHTCHVTLPYGSDMLANT